MPARPCPTSPHINESRTGAITAMLTNPIWVVKTRMFASSRHDLSAYRGLWGQSSSLLPSGDRLTYVTLLSQTVSSKSIDQRVPRDSTRALCLLSLASPTAPSSSPPTRRSNDGEPTSSAPESSRVAGCGVLSTRCWCGACLDVAARRIVLTAFVPSSPTPNTFWPQERQKGSRSRSPTRIRSSERGYRPVPVFAHRQQAPADLWVPRTPPRLYTPISLLQSVGPTHLKACAASTTAWAPTRSASCLEPARSSSSMKISREPAFSLPSHL